METSIRGGLSETERNALAVNSMGRTILNYGHDCHTRGETAHRGTEQLRVDYSRVSHGTSSNQSVGACQKDGCGSHIIHLPAGSGAAHVSKTSDQRSIGWLPTEQPSVEFLIRCWVQYRV